MYGGLTAADSRIVERLCFNVIPGEFEKDRSSKVALKLLGELYQLIITVKKYKVSLVVWYFGKGHN